LIRRVTGRDKALSIGQGFVPTRHPADQRSAGLVEPSKRAFFRDRLLLADRVGLDCRNSLAD